MTEFTFFEIHLHDGLSFSATNTAPAIGGSGGGASDAGTEQSEAGTVADEGGSAPGDGSPADARSGQVRIGALVALVLLVALAAAAKYLRGDDDLELTELDDFAEE